MRGSPPHKMRTLMEKRPTWGGPRSVSGMRAAQDLPFKTAATGETREQHDLRPDVGHRERRMANDIPHSLVLIGDYLAQCDAFWDHWGFEPWEMGPLAGVSRRQRFIKDGFLGPIAEYHAWDCIVWQPGTGEDRKNLWDSMRPLEDDMTQRLLILLVNPRPARRIKSFALGFKGYVEFYAYWPSPEGGTSAKEVKDLADLVDMGLRLALTGHAAKGRGIAI